VSEVVTIAAIAAGGDGVGRLADGRAVFVPRTVPGDAVALGRDVKLHRSFARGEVAEIVTPGPARVAPPCPHYAQDDCGGCQLQHLAYDAQLAAKRTIVGDALRRIGKLAVADPEIVEAIDEWRYRTKITLTAKRAASPADGLTVGLHPHGRPGSVFSLADCQIADFRLMALWRELKQHLDLLPPRLSHLTVRLDREGHRHVIAESAGGAWESADVLRAALTNGDSVVCWWRPPSSTSVRRWRCSPGRGRWSNWATSAGRWCGIYTAASATRRFCSQTGEHRS
jgi:23S rRNA (uracil1939-C5)-methyltransferase